MPRYTKTGGNKGYRKKYKHVNHDAAAKILNNLSPLQFAQLQEIAKHGMGYHTMFGELLSKHSTKKIKPSSFEFYANANNPQEIIEALQTEKEQHSDHSSETHMGGGIRDAHNAVGRWAYDAATIENMNWALDQLDEDTTTPQEIATRLAERGVEHWISDILQDATNRQEIEQTLHHGPQYEDTFVGQGNQVMDTLGWVGGILGATVDFLSDFDTTDTAHEANWYG